MATTRPRGSNETFATVVLDLGFGDAGKGLITDYLTRARDARLIVRFNGGAQAGHNVVTPDGRHHTFAQFGAGTFNPGVRTLLTRDVVVHPTALWVEAQHLASLGVKDALARLSVSGEALMITPFHQAAGRLRELARGAQRHGSCGVGVGETVRDGIADKGGALRIRDLARGDGLGPALRAIQQRKREELDPELREVLHLPAAAFERKLLEDEEIPHRWIEQTRRLSGTLKVLDSEQVERAMREAGRVVLEGAQGVLLDQDYGFHPHTSWGRCTAHTARALLAQAFDERNVKVLGVLRTFSTRHGAGPFPTESAALSRELVDPHNANGPWQGAMRVGPLDLVLLRYALRVGGGVDGLALTHLDALDRMSETNLCARYRFAGAALPTLVETREGEITDLRPTPVPRLDHQEAMGELLRRVSPVLEHIDGAARDGARAFVRTLEFHTAHRVLITSSGPSAGDVRLI